ncbi:hypothetical protein RHMOL_Rhmol13G0307900 [Rhododendron molle]|uniref:Uncharacterized protein n=1 Tax=Rhododendron molle TaxID=49168 RepID=A0ACC0LCT3_RHOML|nr:hypothetical protein RHMOL_Rhmol13G0307900 [Rhododendron molle]
MKVPGGSSIEVNYRVHKFSARGISHPASGRIRLYEVLLRIIEQLKTAGEMHRELLEMLESKNGGYIS